MIVMLLGGLWHGAAWHFVIWGGLHGLFLVANHGWHKLKRIAGWRPEHRSSLGAVVGWLVTMTAVIVAWVFFRAETWDTATSLLTAMAGQNGIFLPLSYETRLGPIAGILGAMGVKFGTEPDPAIYPTLIQFFSIAGLGALVSVLPNTQQWMARCEPALNYASAGTGDFFRRIQWRPNAISGMAMAVLLVIALGFLLKTEGNEFIYFQF
jgi:alginate O-acetyltransferase complex protein AlgI